MPAESVPWWQRRRYWLAVLLFFGFSLFTLLRANLGILIVCMVKHDHRNSSHVVNYSSANTTDLVFVDPPDECARDESQMSKKDETGEFEWDKGLQGLLLGGYYWGYSSGMQVLGGWLSQRYGPRKTLSLGLLTQAIGTLLTPVAVRVSPYLFLAIRITTGATTAVMFPSAPVFWSRWAPPAEWSRLLATSHAGGEMGNALSFPINGFLCSYGGWELPFYTVGGVCVVWCLLWFLIARDSPMAMPGITEAEKAYLAEAIGERVTKHRKYKTPWKSIFKSVPVWACVCSHMMANFFVYTILTQGPTYLNEIMKFDIKANGLFSSLPYISLFLLVVPVGITTDFITSRGYLKLGTVRKLFNTLGMVIPAACLLALGYVPCTHPAAGVALITASVAAFSFCFSGHIVNMADIALIHSGVVAGISNTLASFPGIIAPWVVAYITQQGTQEEWRTAFYIAIVFNVVGATVFLFFASGDPQPWALPPSLNITKNLDVTVEVGSTDKENRWNDPEDKKEAPLVADDLVMSPLITNTEKTTSDGDS